ncbi:cytosine permease [Streptomyces sp. NPDC057486]|uniref:cytosine permease n=1 Tax=Streptomyces sp. NPDC057486 TaxID=3346145 RepID=UPI0036CA52CC
MHLLARRVGRLESDVREQQDRDERQEARGAVSAVVLAASLLIAVGLAGDFVSQFVNLVLVLLVVLVPWTAINLIDFYLVHRGNYALDDLFLPDGGRYGRFNPVALVSYAIGIAVQLPFVATSLCTGPLVAPLGGADLSWLVGLAVTTPAYYLWARNRGEAAPASAQRNAPREPATSA